MLAYARPLNLSAGGVGRFDLGRALFISSLFRYVLERAGQRLVSGRLATDPILSNRSAVFSRCHPTGS